MPDKQEVKQESTMVSLDVVRQLLAEQATQNADNLAKVIAAVKAPNEVEQRKLDAEKRQIDIDQENRRKTSEDVKQTAIQKKANQASCSHERPNGSSHGVFIQEKNGGGYILCQRNQCKIRPEPKPEKGADNGAIYDTAMYNRLAQKLQALQGDIIG